MRRIAMLAFLLVVAASCSRAAGDRAQSIESQVWSPFCPGRLLIDCTTHQASDLRSEIATRVNKGEGTATILRWIRGEFGPEAMAKPTGRAGFVIWIVPALIFVAGAVVVVRVVRRGSVHATNETDKGEPHAHPYR